MAVLLDDQRIEQLQRIGGPGLLSRMVDAFRESARTDITRINRGCADSEPAEVERAAHSLGSAALNLGANELGRLARAVERAAQKEALDLVKPLVDQLEPIFQDVSQRLESFLNRTSSE